MVKPNSMTTGPMQAEAFWNLKAGSESSRLRPGDPKVGDKVSFVRWASEGSRESELIVKLTTEAYIYCEDLQTGEIQVFNRQHYHVAGLGWLEPVTEPAAQEPLLLHGHSYPPCPFGDVLEAEERQGRKVIVAIKHDGGWVVSSERPVWTRRMR